MKEAEKRMQRIAAALNVHRDDPLLHVYSSAQEKLEAITEELTKEKMKVKGLETEIEDLHGEFELDRLDYLETIRKQDQQLKLHQQILDKIQPLLKKESNYHNIEKIKRDAVWSEDQGKWILPELTFAKTALPYAGSVMPVATTVSFSFNDEQSDDESKLRRRLAKSEEENIASNYFKQFNRHNLVHRYKEDSNRSIENFKRKLSRFSEKRNFDDLAKGIVYTEDLYERSPFKLRKPQRLEALTTRLQTS
ncbi:hypothetical protein AB6A40_006781 [Gnathostoma spinigerum]|uniref:Uncharacterized protein n=1 Tax=Gnathostoma spinigerum TaxID=75299 RepID=A0ABD6ETQ8_9BILA